MKNIKPESLQNNLIKVGESDDYSVESMSIMEMHNVVLNLIFIFLLIAGGLYSIILHRSFNKRDKDGLDVYEKKVHLIPIMYSLFLLISCLIVFFLPMLIFDTFNSFLNP